MEDEDEDVFDSIKLELANAPLKGFVAEVYIQVIKHYNDLRHLKAREIRIGLELPPGYTSEISRALKISPRLIRAGVDRSRL